MFIFGGKIYVSSSVPDFYASLRIFPASFIIVMVITYRPTRWLRCCGFRKSETIQLVVSACGPAL